MKAIIWLLMAILCSTVVYSQNAFEAYIYDAQNKEPLPGATAILKESKVGSTTGENGFLTIRGIPDGAHTIEFSYVGYKPFSKSFAFPLSASQPFNVYLNPDSEKLQEVIISTNRSTRTIEDIPTRMEVIGIEELEEKGNMRPGDIRMLLMESTGIQVQQTSPVSGNANFRIQGLDGKYTQLLRDGFPLYSGFSGGLSIMQVPPLDLKRVDIIKGSSSTLYGGGAIAGLINLVSKSPSEEPELSFLVNGTSALGLDLSSFYSQRKNKLGWTVFAAHNRSKAYDPANIGFSAIPQVERFTINPRLFVYLKNTTINLGLNASLEDRLGGDMLYLSGEDKSDRFFERNLSERASSQLGLTHKIKDNQFLFLKNSFNFFNRSIEIPGYEFLGRQVSSFSELSYNFNKENIEWIAGLNLWSDAFKETNGETFGVRDYQIITYGSFIQNIWNINPLLTLESGLRIDYVQPAPVAKLNGIFPLPKISLMYKPVSALTMRIGGGMGYKTPTIFSEEAENLAFQNIVPLQLSSVEMETSVGGNLDFNYKTNLSDEISLDYNQMFFYTELQNPLFLNLRQDNLYQFSNLEGFVSSRGAESNIKFSYDDIKLFVGYTFTDARQHLNGSTFEMPLNSKHRINSVLMFEEHDKYRLGFEAHYFSKQRLLDGASGKSYVIFGIMGEKIWEHFSLYVNLENILDARQTRFDAIYNGTRNAPQFRSIYAPLDGRLFNAGIKIRVI